MKGDIFRSSIMAGICIGIAGLGYLRVGGISGALLFSCGLISVVVWGLKLYTGVSGFCMMFREYKQLPGILFGNVIGCLLVALGSIYSLPGISDSAISVVESRLEKEWYQALVLGIGCGWLMTTAVSNLKGWVVNEKRTWIPLLFAVPMFIICGFLHSVADSFYFFACGLDFLKENCWKVLEVWFSVVLGNFIGCNLGRIVMWNRHMI